MDAERLTGKTAVVTGASRGIGRAVAAALARDGARVALIARSEAPLRDAVRDLGTEAIAVVCDVTDSVAVAAAIESIIHAFDGVPDILVNNAGAFTVAPIESVDPAAFAADLETNLVAPLRFVRAFLPGMRSRGSGHIVSIGSIADRMAFPENAVYAATKHGARALHEVLRLETRGCGVRATLIAPGPVDTALWDSIDPDHRAGFTPRAQMLTPDAVAAAVVYVLTQPARVNVDELRLSHS